MLFGLLQFWFAQNIFGDIGLKPVKKDVEEKIKKTLVDDDHVSCQLFENLQSTRKKIINNMEIYEDDLGIDKVRVKSAISKTFFKVVLKPKESLIYLMLSL